MFFFFMNFKLQLSIVFLQSPSPEIQKHYVNKLNKNTCNDPKCYNRRIQESKKMGNI